jgi:colanic acid/amylovoran biosynthesis glycosyltransferase
MCDLWPGRTVVVAEQVVQDRAAWQFDGPMLVLGNGRIPFWRRALQRGHASAAWRRAVVTRFLRQHHVTVAMVEWLDVGLEWLPLCRAEGLRVIAHSFGYDACEAMLSPAREWRERYKEYEKAEAILSVSQAMNRALHEIGLPREKLQVVPCGTDVPDTCPEPRRADGSIRCLAVGRMVPKKAPILLLDAFRRAAERAPGITLCCVGDGPLYSAACDYVETMGLTDRVRLPGTMAHADVNRETKEADLFVQHSVRSRVDGDEEGLPVSILEAMANGLPVVATRHGGIPDAVVDGETGFLVDEGDTVTMADRIVQLAKDAPLRHRMGEAGWRRARELFSWPQERKNLLQVLGLPALKGEKKESPQGLRLPH